MSGAIDLLVDTNIFIYIFEGNQNASASLTNKTIYYSFITELELLGVPEISDAQKKIVHEALDEGNKIH
jgi:predicted nucleic acid-binding protein